MSREDLMVEPICAAMDAGDLEEVAPSLALLEVLALPASRTGLTAASVDGLLSTLSP